MTPKCPGPPKLLVLPQLRSCCASGNQRGSTSKSTPLLVRSSSGLPSSLFSVHGVMGVWTARSEAGAQNIISHIGGPRPPEDGYQRLHAAQKQKHMFHPVFGEVGGNTYHFQRVLGAPDQKTRIFLESSGAAPILARSITAFFFAGERGAHFISLLCLFAASSCMLQSSGCYLARIGRSLNEG